MNMCSWGLRCASDSELAAAVVEHSVAVRVTSPEDLQLVSTRRVLHRLLRICKTCDVVVDIWVSIPCTAGVHFRLNNEKLCAETGDLAMTYKLVVAAVGLCRHAVRIGDGFSWERSNGNELWDFLLFCLDRSFGSTICRSRGRHVISLYTSKSLRSVVLIDGTEHRGSTRRPWTAIQC